MQTLPSANFGHEWERELGKLSDRHKIVREWLPNVLEKPSRAFEKRGRFIYVEKTDRFLRRIYDGGKAAGRYRELPFIDVGAYDLHKLDNICFLLRALGFPLRGEIRTDGGEKLTMSGLSAFDIDRTIRENKQFRKSNFSFFHKQENRPELVVSMSSSPLIMAVLQADQNSLNWLIKNSKITKKTIAKVRDCL